MLSGCMRAYWQNSMLTLAISRSRLAAYSPCDLQKSRSMRLHSSSGSTGHATAIGVALLTDGLVVPSQRRRARPLRPKLRVAGSSVLSAVLSSVTSTMSVEPLASWLF